MSEQYIDGQLNSILKGSLIFAKGFGSIFIVKRWTILGLVSIILRPDFWAASLAHQLLFGSGSHLNPGFCVVNPAIGMSGGKVPRKILRWNTAAGARI